MNYLSRLFLNKKEGMAAMQVSFEASTHYVESSVVISDCNRQINLDFSSSSAKMYKEKLGKLSTLISELGKLESHMYDFQESAEFKKMYK